MVQVAEPIVQVVEYSRGVETMVQELGFGALFVGIG